MEPLERVQDIKSEVEKEINDRVDSSVQNLVDEALMRPLEDVLNPIIDADEALEENESE